jgi:hypothetical protein
VHQFVGNRVSLNGFCARTSEIRVFEPHNVQDRRPRCRLDIDVTLNSPAEFLIAYDAILQAFKTRRMYGATDNILADVRANGHFMGEEFSTNEPPNIDVKLVGTANFAKVQVIKDSKYVYTTEPRARTVEFSWCDNGVTPGQTSYYYVRGEQEDGELIWVSPMRIKVR